MRTFVPTYLGSAFGLTSKGWETVHGQREGEGIPVAIRRDMEVSRSIIRAADGLSSASWKGPVEANYLIYPSRLFRGGPGSSPVGGVRVLRIPTQPYSLTGQVELAQGNRREFKITPRFFTAVPEMPKGEYSPNYLCIFPDTPTETGALLHSFLNFSDHGIAGVSLWPQGDYFSAKSEERPSFDEAVRAALGRTYKIENLGTYIGATKFEPVAVRQPKGRVDGYALAYAIPEYAVLCTRDKFDSALALGMGLSYANRQLTREDREPFAALMRTDRDGLFEQYGPVASLLPLRVLGRLDPKHSGKA